MAWHGRGVFNKRAGHHYLLLTIIIIIIGNKYTTIAGRGTIWVMGFWVYKGLAGLGNSPGLWFRSGPVWLRCNLDGLYTSVEAAPSYRRIPCRLESHDAHLFDHEASRCRSQLLTCFYHRRSTISAQPILTPETLFSAHAFAQASRVRADQTARLARLASQSSADTPITSATLDQRTYGRKLSHLFIYRFCNK